MADRLRRVLAQRWLQTLVPVIAGVALGVWFFVGLGFPSRCDPFGRAAAGRRQPDRLRVRASDRA